MSPTLLEGLVVLVLLVVAWQIGLVLAPVLLRVFKRLGRDLDAAGDQSASDSARDNHVTKERSNGSRQ